MTSSSNFIEPRNQNIENIFSEFYEIPNFQRPYSWEDDKAKKLIEDLYGAFENNDTEYFFGSIIVYKKEKEKINQIVDGQQRIITLTILLSVLYRVLREKECSNSDLLNLINSLFKNYNLSSNKSDFKLKIKDMSMNKEDSDTDFFRDYIQDKDKNNSNDILKKESKKLFVVKKRIRNNFEIFYKFINIEGNFVSVDNIEEFTRYILNKVLIIKVECSDLKTSLKIFSIINSRGLALSTADILKAEILSRIDESSRDIYAEKWEYLGSKVNLEELLRIISHIYHIAEKGNEKKYEGSLLDFYDKFLEEEKEKPEIFIEKRLEKYGAALEFLQKNYRSDDNYKGRNVLDLLNRINNNDWLVPAVMYLSNNDKYSEETIEFFEKLEAFSGALWYLKTSQNDRYKKYFPLLKEIKNNHKDTLYDLMKLDKRGEDDIKYNLCDDLYGRSSSTKSKGKYTLLKLNYLKWKEEDKNNKGLYQKIEGMDNFTIEHILPQKPDESWSYISEEDRKLWTNKIANLLILNRFDNPSARNKSFETKKPYYVAGGFTLSKYILDNNDKWDIQELKDFQFEYINLILSNIGINEVNKEEFEEILNKYN